MKTRVLSLLFIFVLASCAQNANKVTCTPNFEGSGMKVHVSFIGDNQNGTAAYLFQLCQDAIPAGFGFSVYGMSSNGSVTDLENQVRERHLTSASSYSGSQFQVNMRTLDTYFVIYLDDQQGGSFVLSNTTEMVRGDITSI